MRQWCKWRMRKYVREIIAPNMCAKICNFGVFFSFRGVFLKALTTIILKFLQINKPSLPANSGSNNDISTREANCFSTRSRSRAAEKYDIRHKKRNKIKSETFWSIMSRETRNMTNQVQGNSFTVSFETSWQENMRRSPTFSRRYSS